MMSLLGSRQGGVGGVEVGRIGWGYLLGGIVELFGLTVDCDRDLFPCDDDDDDLYDDLQQPPTRNLSNSIFLKAQTKQKHKVMYPLILFRCAS
jgi:hypothetical protein